MHAVNAELARGHTHTHTHTHPHTHKHANAQAYAHTHTHTHANEGDRPAAPQNLMTTTPLANVCKRYGRPFLSNSSHACIVGL